MTWKSVINEMPECDQEHPFYPEGYEEWLEKVTAEPWFRALEDIVRWTGVWVGTEEQLFEELEMRAGKEIFASPDFPKDFERLNLYMQIARDGFIAKHLAFWHHRELTEEDLDHYDVPGWGLEAPILVYQGDAARRPDYWQAMCDLLAQRDALPLAILIFTGEDNHFRRFRKWMGTTTELIEKLGKHRPRLGPVPFFLANLFRPEERHGYEVGACFYPPNLLDPLTREDYIVFHKQMRRSARVLKEFRITVSWQKRPYSRRSPESGRREPGSRTYWTIERPRWRKPDLIMNPDIPARDLPILIASWLAPKD